MERIVFPVAAIVFASINVASAQDFTAAQHAACEGAYDKFCKGTMPGGGVLAGLSKQHDALSDAGNQVVDAKKK